MFENNISINVTTLAVNPYVSITEYTHNFFTP
jgi:hypothetical protein